MIQVRRNVFETNSSSTHSITMCMEEDYDKWNDGGLYFYSSSYRFDESTRNRFFTYEEMIDFLKNNLDCEDYRLKAISDAKECGNISEFEHLIHFYEFYTYNSYEYYHDYEHYEETFTTPSGDKVVSFGYFGWDA